MAQLENIEALEKRLWAGADNLRANSNYASNEYFVPVMGLIFLRHAYSRYLAVKPEIEASLPSRGGQVRPLTKEDFSRKSAIFLKSRARFDYLVHLKDGDDRAQAIIDAMEAIEADYQTLKGVLPKSEYQFLGKADFVMANPPFNVDDVDAEKIKNDPRLPFGLPGVNKKGAVSNGNYLWISYFYSYLNQTGRAGFVMSSQASSAGGQEAEVRRKLVESGDVGAMIAIRANFFYTRSVPCELWFFNKNKPEHLKNKVLMLDARNVYRKVTRKIYDFSPEQLANLTSIIWLYRGEPDRFLKLIESYLQRTVDEAKESDEPITCFRGALEKLLAQFSPDEETSDALRLFTEDVDAFAAMVREAENGWTACSRENAGLLAEAELLEPLAERSRDLIKEIDQLYKFAEKLSNDNGARGRGNPAKALDAHRKDAVEQLKQLRYFFKQAHWLQERFPQARLRDVEGLVKLVDKTEIEANDWSLTPGRYVGVAPEVEDEVFDFEETLRDIHIELQGLNEEAAGLAAKIQKNFEELGV